MITFYHPFLLVLIYCSYYHFNIRILLLFKKKGSRYFSRIIPHSSISYFQNSKTFKSLFNRWFKAKWTKIISFQNKEQTTIRQNLRQHSYSIFYFQIHWICLTPKMEKELYALTRKNQDFNIMLSQNYSIKGGTSCAVKEGKKRW